MILDYVHHDIDTILDSLLPSYHKWWDGDGNVIFKLFNKNLEFNLSFMLSPIMIQWQTGQDGPI
jgi:hypothetical protein